MNLANFPNYSQETFMGMNAAEISSLPNAYFRIAKMTWSKEGMRSAYAKCVAIGEFTTAKVLFVNMQTSRKVHSVIGGYLKYRLLLSNSANYEVAGIIQTDHSFSRLCLSLLTLISFEFTPSVTDIFLTSIGLKLRTLIDTMTITQNISLFEMTCGVWATIEAWNFLDHHLNIRKTVSKLNNMEYILYCIENITQVFIDPTVKLTMSLKPRQFHSITEVTKEGGMPRVDFIQRDGTVASAPEHQKV